MRLAKARSRVSVFLCASPRAVPTSWGSSPHRQRRSVGHRALPKTLSLKLSAFTPDEREAVEAALQQDPKIGMEWTGLSPLKALRWRKDGMEYSATRLILEILHERAVDAGPCPDRATGSCPPGRASPNSSLPLFPL